MSLNDVPVGTRQIQKSTHRIYAGVRLADAEKICFWIPAASQAHGKNVKPVGVFFDLSQRGKVKATPRSLATICSMMSVVSISLCRLGLIPAGV